jgi:hypothetical protein
MTRRLVLAALVVAVAGAAAGALTAALAPPPGTYALLDDVERASGGFSAAQPVPLTCVLWAGGDAEAPDALSLGGTGHTLRGCAHSNADVRFAGSQSTFVAPVRYVTTLEGDASQHQLENGTLKVRAAPDPRPVDLGAFAPDRHAPTDDYFVHQGDAALGARSGVHYVFGNATVDASGFVSITVVATGDILVDLTEATLVSRESSLLFGSEGGSVTLQGAWGDLTGLVKAPRGRALLDVQTCWLTGQVGAAVVELAGSSCELQAFAPLRREG